MAKSHVFKLLAVGASVALIAAILLPRLETNEQLYEKGQAALLNKEYARAEHIWKKFVDRYSADPRLPYAYSQISSALLEQNRLSEAEAAIRQALQLSNTKVWSSSVEKAAYYNLLGVILQKQQKPEAAIAAYREASKHNPKYTYAYNNLGVVLRQQGKFDEAVSLHRKAISIRYENAIAHILLGRALTAKKNYPAAIAAYQAALKIQADDSTHGAAYLGMGDALKANKKFAEAIAAYQKTLKLTDGHDAYEGYASNHAEAHSRLGEIFQAQGNLKQAAAEYKQAIALDPTLTGAQSQLKQVEP